MADPQIQSAFDQRLIELDIQLPGQDVMTFSDLAIYASGCKFGSANQSTCEARIYNLTREQRNNILTLSSPLGNRDTPVNMSLRVGRQSYGTFLLFTGNVIQSNVTQPPDIGITLRSLTSNYMMGVILGFQQPAMSLLSTIAQALAEALGLQLDNQATDKQINNFSFTGSPMNGVIKLNQIGGVQAFIDNNTLVVLDAGKARNGAVRVLSASTGMVGIPQVTEQGCMVRMMIDNSVRLGSSIQVVSEINPAANGIYKVVKINYEVASRDQPFWYNLECSNLAYYQGQN